MAIYKPTYCYPYGGNINFCIDQETIATYLQCKINTNNKKVTGYRLSLVDSNGEKIWEPESISPLWGTNQTDHGPHHNSDVEDASHGQGFNGDTLIVPFVQNYNYIMSQNNHTFSPNCLYCDIEDIVDYYIEISSSTVSLVELQNNTEIKDWNNHFSDSSVIGIGNKILVYYNNNYIICTVTTSGINTSSGDNKVIAQTENVYIKYGNTYHNKVMKITIGNPSTIQENGNWLYYVSDFNNSNHKLFLSSLTVLLGEEYSWIIISLQPVIA